MDAITFESVLLSFLSFFTAYVIKKVLEVDKGLEVLKKDVELIKELLRKCDKKWDCSKYTQ